jgi:hypothetical protein
MQQGSLAYKIRCFFAHLQTTQQTILWISAPRDTFLGIQSYGQEALQHLRVEQHTISELNIHNLETRIAAFNGPSPAGEEPPAFALCPVDISVHNAGWEAP